MTSARICLLTSAHLSYNPRLLKEADALHAAGYSVRVVAMRLQADKARWDEELMARRGWELVRLDAGRDNLVGRWRWFKGVLRQRMYLRSHWLRQSRWGLEKAYSRYFPELAQLAARVPADLFIAHNLQALPAAARAARRWRSKLGFDAEDFHSGEFLSEGSTSSPLCKLTEATEKKYLPQCQHRTAASDGIGAAYAKVLGFRPPVTVFNVFPLSERQGHTPRAELKRERPGAGLSLYWYSQVIGGDRGLEDVLQAMATLGSGVQLSLRGTWADGYEKVFRERARVLGVEKQIHILPLAPPNQLVERAAQHDVGLALETGETENRRIAVTNKILNYYLAGLAIAATDIPGQRGILEQTRGAGFLFTPGEVASLTQHLRVWMDDPQALRAAKLNSAQWGVSRYCWDIEQVRLLRAVQNVLGT